MATEEASLTPERLAEISINSYFKLHGLPDAAVAYRGPWFTGGFWQHLTRLRGTRARMSIAFHPQTDGQAEKASSIVERYLRTFAASNEPRWGRLL